MAVWKEKYTCNMEKHFETIHFPKFCPKFHIFRNYITKLEQCLLKKHLFTIKCCLQKNHVFVLFY